MKTGSRLALSFLLTLILWAVFSWPLPLHAHRGIPSSSQNVESEPARKMIPGDHLQLLYHFWLFSDMLAGDTPWFYNLYEFNTGDDAARYRPHNYYLPFSFVYAVTSYVAPRALAWNVTGLLALWLTYFFTWSLLRHLGARESTAAVLGLVGLLLPYRWAAWLGGSPAGLAMTWVPGLLLGLEGAIRRERFSSSLLAGLCILSAGLSDPHVFYFSVFCVPAWCVLCLLLHEDFFWNEFRCYGRLVLRLIPFATFAALAIGFNRYKQQYVLSETISQSRGWSEVALFSPGPEGLLSWSNLGHNNQVFIGYTVVVLLALGGLCLVWQFLRSPSDYARRFFAWLLLAAGLAGILALALGTYGPFQGAAFRLARRFVPFYDIMRQSGKIMCLAPTLIPVALLFAVNALLSLSKYTWWRAGLLTLCAAALLAEYKETIRPTICLLDTEQSAYREVVLDPVRGENPPRAVAIPLWPGDSAWSSLYEYYASLYRIRLMNGYSPVTPSDYFEATFRPFSSLNQGYMDDALADELLARGFHHLLLHENAFPEKVSPFPVGLTLRRLLIHPRLTLLKHDDTVWCFRILAEPEKKPETAESWVYAFPARRYELERCKLDARTERDQLDAQGHGYVVLQDEEAWVKTKPTQLAPTGDLRWMIRCRGEGKLTAITLLDDVEHSRKTVKLTAKNWTWRDVPIPDVPSYTPVSLRLTSAAGAPEVDACVLATGPWEELKRGEQVTIPAPCLFHAGFSDLEANAVVFRTAYEQGDAILAYGPYLPLKPGSYRLELHYQSPAAPGTLLGKVYVPATRSDPKIQPVLAGEGFAVEFEQPDNQLFRFDFVYLRAADMTLENVVLTRL